jgi:flagellar biosynthesis anti-sigma factor FlgM
MRIDGFQNIPAILQSLKTDKVGGNGTDNGKDDGSSVSLSAFGEILQSLQRESSQRLQARATKVEQLTHEVRSGQFEVNLEKLAASLVDLHIVDPRD